jgi:YidC/Oxa1 family membrane protein insertase
VNLQTSWGPGVGCNVEHRKEETLLMRVVTASYAQKGKYVINKLAPGQYFLSKYAWLGMDNRYFCVIMLNPCAPLFCSHFDQISVSKVTDEKLFEVNLSTRIVLAAGARTGFSIPFYIGPKDYTQLTKLGYGMREIVDFGFFAELAKFAFHSLRYLYRITGNYGVAIILLTIIIQALFYPLTVKSYKASAGMKLLQPKIKEIQQKIGNDPKRMNAEMLNLYKTQKVNPLGGCLPLLIQMPIFWALFVTLRNIYELRQAPFILWIKDLSAPDMLFSAFGFPVRLLPLFMGISMYVQQTLSGASTDPSQKMLVYLMPVMFTFIFWNFPSGLVLYWLINNVVTIGVQYTITKKQAAHEKFASKVIDAEVIDARGLKKP